MVVAVSMYMLMYPRVSVSTECGSTIILWFYNNFVVSISRFFITVSCLLYSLPVFHSQLFAYFYNKSTPAVIETRPFTAISSHICVLLTSLV